MSTQALFVPGPSYRAGEALTRDVACSSGSRPVRMTSYSPNNPRDLTTRPDLDSLRLSRMRPFCVVVSVRSGSEDRCTFSGRLYWKMCA
jgi:hypothetical protein